MAADLRRLAELTASSIEEARAQRPEPVVRFAAKGDVAAEAISLERGLLDQPIDIESIIDTERERAMATLPPEPRDVSAGKAALGIPDIPEQFRALSALGGGRQGPPTAEERDKFAKSVERYLEEIRDWLTEFITWRDERAHRISLRLRFKNLGRVPCYGARVDVHFPDPFGPYDEGADPPWPPDRPKFHRPSPLDPLLRHHLVAPYVPDVRGFRNVGPQPNVSRPRYRKDSLHVDFEIEKLLHGLSERSDVVTVVAPAMEPSPFNGRS